ncbi:unnamed protein product [Psylliodes chrysocephalus]|uniref:Uncharacterized protein n=1 Tax=Psylliodes chrysocephalus TaxID=3402493 RepID=A0A9P0GEX6_9CUCU|nr:unnamed protein product [Psylliodes chrysocephala]
MSPKNKTKSREELLEQKRIAERLRYERLKKDPKKKEELREKERRKYQMEKEKGTRKLDKDMNRREHNARLEKTNMKNIVDTPNTKLQKMGDVPETRKEVVKKAIFSEILNEQLKENYAQLKTFKEKQIFGKVMSGTIVNKYKLWRNKESAISYKRIQKSARQSTLVPTAQTRLGCITSQSIKTVRKFYETDDNSRIGAGKRECITRNVVKNKKEVPSVEKFTWNFSETGHGKGAPDWVGTTCKRSADAVIAAGDDIDSLKSFVEIIQQRCPRIIIFTIDDEDI